jgi:hypothetical protein
MVLFKQSFTNDGMEIGDEEVCRHFLPELFARFEALEARVEKLEKTS